METILSRLMLYKRWIAARDVKPTDLRSPPGAYIEQASLVANRNAFNDQPSVMCRWSG